MSDFRWATPSRADDADWLELLAAIEHTDRRGETYAVVDLDDEWASVWADPEHDAVFVRHDATGTLVAFGWDKGMPGDIDANKVACWGGVHPGWRGQGIGRTLLGWQLERGRALARGFGDRLPTRVEVDALTTQHDLLGLAGSFGFERVRGFLEVVRPNGPTSEVDPPVGLQLADWDDRYDEPTRLAHADAFSEDRGVEPRTPDAWRQWYTGHRAFRPDLSVVALDDGEVIGFVLCAAYPQDWGSVPREVWINSVGTCRPWRRRGVARWLLSRVVDRVDAAGDRFERSILGVDDSNAGALRLYRSLGFVDERQSIALGLLVPPT